MPNQQPRTNEHRWCGTSSKNAKEKSNSTILMAIRDSKDGDSSSGRGSRCSSEKDSGYSDGSDWQHTDAEDQQSNKSRSRGSEHARTSQPGQNQQLGQRNSGNVPCVPVAHDHPHIYIIKDMVLKQQPSVIQKRAQLQRTNDMEDSNSSSYPHVILLQQPGLVPPPLQLHKPLSRRSNVTGRKGNCGYLPILKSYPRIAPHPSKKPCDKPSSSHESQNLTKRVCTDSKTDDAPVVRGLPEQCHHKQPKLVVSACSLPSSSTTREGLSSSDSTTASTNHGSPSVSSLHTGPSSPFLTSRGHHRSSASSTRHRRLLNTVEILQQSGLLDITLRTKELLRQSSATEQGIAQLRQHTELLCQAASNPDAATTTTTWEHLHRVMADSGNYPDLKALPNLHTPAHPDSAGQPESISTEDTNTSQDGDTSEASSSPTVENVRAHSEQDGELQAGRGRSDPVTFVPPDSSTG